MTLLIVGVALFSVTHMVPRWRALRKAAVDRLGEMGYKAVYSLVALAALVLIVRGYKGADFVPVYEPFEKGRAIAHALMPFSFILAAGANMRSNLKRYVRHPLSLSVMLWALSHLAANGDLASVILFGGMFAFAAVNMGLSMMAEQTPPPPPQPRGKDVILIVAGLVGYAAVVWAHGAVFGVYVAG
ncbi:MAG: NnrU family protein [Pseudomonadota bacterium]